MKKLGILIVILMVALVSINLSHISDGRVNNQESKDERQIVKDENLDEFDKMSLEIGAANVEVIEGDNYSINIDMDKKIAISYKIENQTLEVIQKSNKDKLDEKHFENNLGNNIIVITIPKGKELKLLKGEQGLGEWKINDLSIQEINIEMGVGNCVLNNIVNKGLIVEGGVGNIDINGEIKGDIDIEGGLGRIYLKTTLPESQYYYELEKGLGGIIFNDKVIESEESFGDNKAPYHMNISSGVGSIEIETK